MWILMKVKMWPAWPTAHKKTSWLNQNQFSEEPGGYTGLWVKPHSFLPNITRIKLYEIQRQWCRRQRSYSILPNMQISWIKKSYRLIIHIRESIFSISLLQQRKKKSQIVILLSILRKKKKSYLLSYDFCLFDNKRFFLLFP